MVEPTPILPPHIESTVQAIAQLHAEHHKSATSMQRIVDSLTSIIGQPAFVGVLTILVLLWCIVNLVMQWTGHTAWDEPPFFWLQGAIGLAALYVAVLILTSNRHADQLAEYREQLTLELAILSEQKSAKIIQLLEEMRRDDPSLRNRHDPEAQALSISADPQHLLDAIKDAHEELQPSQPREPASEQTD
jgi:uncharacterized membrane protein